jgi:hypothetical protein
MDCSRAKTKDPDEWLEAAPEFSRPLAAQVRDWIQRWEPDLAESIKWNMLCFSGRKLVCGLSACKAHLGIAFFRGTDLPDPARLFNQGGESNTAILSIRLTTLDGFDSRAFRALLRAAVEFDADPASPPPPKIKREPWPVPDFLAAALKKERKAAANFAAMSPSCQREYIVWLTTAKREETRRQRLAQTLAALASGMKWAQRKSPAG